MGGVNVSLRAITPDGRVTLRLRVGDRVAEALYDEASHQRISASALVERVLRDALPALAEDRIRRQVHGVGAR
jgi:hypothetical protein